MRTDFLDNANIIKTYKTPEYFRVFLTETTICVYCLNYIYTKFVYNKK